MKKAFGLCFVITGAALILSAVSLAVYNILQDRSAQKEADTALTEIKSTIPEIRVYDPAKPDYEAMTENDLPDAEQPEEPAVEVGESKYLGYVSVPSVGLELPVMSEYSEENMKSAPCRYFGTLSGGDLIIAAHNYRSFFDKLDEVQVGDTIEFVDASGLLRRYEVVETDLIGGRETSKMKAGSEWWDITLFTCNYSGYSRVTVRGKLI